MKDLMLFHDDKLLQIDLASHLIVKKLSENYEEMIDHMVGKADTTKETYKRNVRHFIAFIQNNGINSMSLGEFRNALEEVDVKPNTKNIYLSSARMILREALKYGLLPVDISQNVPDFKIERGHVKDGVQENELGKVKTAISTIKRAATRRKVLAMFHLFAGEGLRQMEVQQIKVEDINFVDRYILIRGKGMDGKQLHRCLIDTIEVLKNYLGEAGITSGYIFPSKRNKGEPIALRSIRRFFTEPIKGVFARADVRGRSVHGFRHFFTTKTLEIVNGDLHKTKRRTRHQATQTIEVYDDRRLSKEDMKVFDERLKL